VLVDAIETRDWTRSCRGSCARGMGQSEQIFAVPSATSDPVGS